jgi:putative ABC transport system permease protein
MWELARRNLLRERTRFLAATAGVAFAVILMLSLAGIYNSYNQRVARYFGGTGADLWVVQTGTANFFHSSSIVPASAGTTIGTLPGVASVRPYVGRQVAFMRNGHEYVTYAVGVPLGTSVGGSVSLVAGRGTVGHGEIVIDRVMARKAGLDLGDTVTLRGVSFRIVGLTSGGDMVMYQYAWVSLPEAYRLQGSSSFVNFFLVNVLSGADVYQVAAAIERAVPGVQAWTPEHVITENQGPIRDSFLPVVAVILVIGFAVGTIVIGLTTYSSVLEKRREYGVLKALGAGFGTTLMVVLSQSGASGLVGYVAGLVLTIGLGAWLPRVVPQFVLTLTGIQALWVLLAAAGMVVVSATLPLWRLARIDPAEVFQS